ncbi:segregation and condensation protein A [Bifidobacterium simiiventris]|uniref:segregation and condensation protein A n=1 Tax=Bifidobacterium simiiventris TaxID=2834434 RepID=UPI003B82FEF1
MSARDEHVSGPDSNSDSDSSTAPAQGFRVNLDVYSGPFDVLLGMIADQRLELTEVSLSTITEGFLDYVRGMDKTGDMDEASAFIDVASVLVEAKSAALLPGGDDGDRDEQSLEALRERDLLFARLLQYRAFKTAAGDFRSRIDSNRGRFAHPAALDASMAALLPELTWTIGSDDLARIAARAIADAPADTVATSQLHVPLVDLQAQADLVRERLSSLPDGEALTFAQLTQDAASRIEIVARFLAVLAFFKQGALQFKQDGPYAPLHVRWVHDGTGETAGNADISERDFA